MKFLLKNIIVSFLLASPMLVFAQIGLQNPISVDSITDLILIVTRVVRFIALPFVVIMIMYAGWLYLYNSYQTSGKNMADAHRVLGYVLLGAFILLSSELIAIVIRNTVTGLTTP